MDLPEASKAGIWEVGITGVTLEADENEIRLRVSNREAECRSPGSLLITYKPVKPAPVVEFLSPRDSVTVEAPKLTVRIRVQSESALTEVRLLREGAAPITLDLTKLKPDAKGHFELLKDEVVSLAPGANNLRLEARNADGLTPAALVATYQRRPVRLVIDGMGEKGKKPLTPDLLAGGMPAFDKMPAGRVQLHGHVAWDEGDDEDIKKTGIVRVYVNGFQQLPAVLLPAEKGRRERAFHAELLLNEAEKNLIRVALPGLARDASSPTDFAVDCEKPVRAQRLHLLIVSTQEKDPKALKARFLQALQSTSTKEGDLKTTAFDRIYLYPRMPLTGEKANWDYVYSQLVTIKENIKDQAGSGQSYNDVVVFYYQGGESIDAQGHLFRTGGGQAKAPSFSCDDLARLFGDTPGAHILLFDVGREAAKENAGRDKVEKWPNNYPDVTAHVAVLRYAFLGRGDAPKAPSLVKALADFMPQSTRLIEVANLMRTSAEAEKDDRPQVDQFIGERVGGIEVNRKK